MTSRGSSESQSSPDFANGWSSFLHNRSTTVVSSSSSLDSTMNASKTSIDTRVADPLQFVSSTFGEPVSGSASSPTIVPVLAATSEISSEKPPPLVKNPLAYQTAAAPSTTILMQTSHVPIMPSLSKNPNQATDATAANNNTVPEFLYQLTKMLTDDNKEVIEWANSRIEVHNPHRLASEVLHKYFRHSKFASFQRQLNYFGFRKLAGKGKMAPCSYVNDATGTELRSLLQIKVRLITSYFL